ncbi:hypothetical protein [Halorubellus sp. PRR65]|uniref:hypothetical protein n=1 Tax=Halorubellus sp. PRR65 TaxID=3098148 RepID=UPI002B25DA33|nr:hypothetical protein [Halorubellus sp. PRR65]
MVKKFTLLELHLDDARFSNAVGSTPEAAAELLDDTDEDIDGDVDVEMEMDDVDGSSRSIGRTLGRAAFLVVLAVGIRTIARRMLSDDVEGVEDVVREDSDSVAVDLDESVEA